MGKIGDDYISDENIIETEDEAKQTAFDQLLKQIFQKFFITVDWLLLLFSSVEFVIVCGLNE